MRFRVWAPVCGAVLIALLALDLRVQPGGTDVTRAVDYFAMLLTPLIAGTAAIVRAVQVSGRRRTSWLLIGLGSLGWAAGEAVWTYLEYFGGTQTPFPSLADVGYLLFPALAGTGLLLRPSRAFAGRARLRVAIDATLIGISVFSVLWATALGAVYHGGAESSLGAIVGLAYPASDLALLTIVLVVLVYARTDNRAGLIWIAAGIGAFAIGDSGFAYLTASGTYQTGNLVDAGWAAGFLILALSALFDGNGQEAPETERPPQPSALILPYVPSAVGALVSVVQLRNHPGDTLSMGAIAVIVLLLIVRQVIVLLDDRRLLDLIGYRAGHDPLTGLANRALFNDRLEHALERRRRTRCPIALLLLDLDDFKNVNDTLGHPVGDQLLIQVGERIRNTVRASDTAARLGGDEFVVLAEDGNDALTLANRILAAIGEPVHLNERTLAVRTSIGIATATDDELPSATAMMQRADVAMYAAKNAGKGAIRMFSPDMADSNVAFLDLGAALAADLSTGAIDVAFQPIRRPDGELYGYETLARWTHDGVAVAPAEFLPLANSLGLLAVLDELVLEAALRAAATWDPAQVVSVNMDGQTLADPLAGDRVLALLARTGVAPERLALEVPEASLVDGDAEVLRTLRMLRGHGVRMSVDGFSVGYSVFVRLRDLQPDIVKVDSRVEADAGDPGSQLTGITRLAHSFGSLVIAERIETEDQLTAATIAGCDAVQGYLLGAPGRTIDRSTEHEAVG